MANDRSRITSERVAEAASRLSPDEREALALSAGDRLSCDELAGQLGLSVEAAEALLARALLKLERTLRRQTRPWWHFW